MADKKISGLDAALTVDPDDLIALVQGSPAENKKATLEQVLGLVGAGPTLVGDPSGEEDSGPAFSALNSSLESAGGGGIYLKTGTYLFGDGDYNLHRTVSLIGSGSAHTEITAAKTALDSGTASSGGNSTLTDSTKSWETNEWAGKVVEITGGTGGTVDRIRTVISNTATALTVSPVWTTNPGNDSAYKIYTPSRMLVRGSGSWQHNISDIRFTGFTIVYGLTTSDYGNGGTIRDCQIRDALSGVEYSNNCWLTVILSTKIHHCARGVYFNFEAATTGAGAACRLNSVDIFNCHYAVNVHGATLDGYDLHFVSTNLENSVVGLMVEEGTPGADRVIQSIGGHWELCRDYYVHADCASIWLNGFWMHAGESTQALFRLEGDNRIWVSQGRLACDYNKLCDLQGGSLIVDADTIFSGTRFFGKGDPLATAASTSGGIYSGGPAYDNRRGKVFTGQSNVTIALPTDGSDEELTRVRPFDRSHRVLEFHLEVSVAASASQLFRVYLNAGGGHIDAVLPALTGRGQLRIVYEPLGTLSVDGFFMDSGGGVTVIHDSLVDNIVGIDDTKWITCASVSTEGTRATMHVRHLFEYLH